MTPTEQEWQEIETNEHGLRELLLAGFTWEQAETIQSVCWKYGIPQSAVIDILTRPNPPLVKVIINDTQA